MGLLLAQLVARCISTAPWWPEPASHCAPRSIELVWLRSWVDLDRQASAAASGLSAGARHASSKQTHLHVPLRALTCCVVAALSLFIVSGRSLACDMLRYMQALKLRWRSCRLSLDCV